jgi:hypothetical protein
MLFILAVCLFCTAYYLLNHKIRHRKRRQWTGLALVTLGATATFFLDTLIEEPYIYSFTVIWFIGLELFFNCDKYRDEY